MKPFDKSYVLEKINEYNNKINKNKIGDYEIKSRDGLQGMFKDIYIKKKMSMI